MHDDTSKLDLLLSCSKRQGNVYSTQFEVNYLNIKISIIQSLYSWKPAVINNLTWNILNEKHILKSFALQHIKIGAFFLITDSKVSFVAQADIQL